MFSMTVKQRKHKEGGRTHHKSLLAYWMRSEGGGSQAAVPVNVSRGRRVDRLPAVSLPRAHREEQAENDVGDDGSGKQEARRGLRRSA